MASTALTAFLFPGQGAQAVGMGADVYHASPAARRVFEQADDALNLPLSALILQGPKDELARTENAQPAILCVSIAYLRAMEERLGTEAMPAPALVAGHSLGEYTALVAAGAMDLGTGLGLVRRRGQLMQEASDRTPSAMAALLGMELEAVQQLCRETGAQLANVNSAQQMVIAGPLETMEKAQKLAKERGARRAIRLDVSGAFHTEVMRPALAELEEALAKVEFMRPSAPIVANTTALPIDTPDQIGGELARQLCTCVQWQQSVEYMASQGVPRFIEIGPGDVLTGLTRRIQPNAQAMSAGGLDGLAAPAVS